MTAAPRSAQRKELHPEKRSWTLRYFEEGLRARVVGQDEALQAVVDLYQVFCACLNSPGRSIGNLGHGKALF
jgi:ATP-dependent Clp protease ATP-binding subunit ClpA